MDTEVALVVAAITNEANYLQQAKAIEEMEKRKERVDMYEMMEILYSESYSKGMMEGRIEGEISGEIKGIIKTVLSLVKKKLGTISEEVREKIENSSQEKLEELTNDIFEIESEEDVMKVLR